jgi:hypothetical protein
VPFHFLLVFEFLLFTAGFAQGGEFAPFGFVVFSFELFEEFTDHAHLGARGSRAAG